MSKTFTYFKKTGEIRRPVDYGYGIEYEDDGDEGYEFEHEVDDRDLEYACAELLYDDYFKKSKINDYACYWSGVKNSLVKIIGDFDLLDILVESYEDELKSYFEDDAQSSQD